MILLVLSALAFHQEPVIMSGRRQPPVPWQQAMTARCGRNALDLSDFGTVYPAGLQPSVNVDGHPVTGPEIDRLKSDLAHRTGVYRFEVLCTDEGGFSVRIVVGERPVNGEAVVYQIGSALIQNGRLTEYSGLEPSTDDSFWYR